MSEGNYLRQSRKNFFLSADCIQMMEELSRHEGLRSGGIIEQAVRMMFRDRFGKDAQPKTPRQIKSA